MPLARERNVTIATLKVALPSAHVHANLQVITCRHLETDRHGHVISLHMPFHVQGASLHMTTRAQCGWSTCFLETPRAWTLAVEKYSESAFPYAQNKCKTMHTQSNSSAEVRMMSFGRQPQPQETTKCLDFLKPRGRVRQSAQDGKESTCSTAQVQSRC